jgi:predicted cupin superfamily sugar epimerase
MSETLTADEIIALFELKPHPEGGHYRETFRDALGHGARAHSTAILFLLKAGEVSRWHKVDAAEHWHSHGGAPLLLEIRDGDVRREVRLGPGWREGDVPHAIVPAHAWQSARSLGDWTLVGCSVAPGFDFQASNSRPRTGSLSSPSPLWGEGFAPRSCASEAHAQVAWRQG